MGVSRGWGRPAAAHWRGRETSAAKKRGGGAATQKCRRRRCRPGGCPLPSPGRGTRRRGCARRGGAVGWPTCGRGGVVGLEKPGQGQGQGQGGRAAGSCDACVQQWSPSATATHVVLLCCRPSGILRSRPGVLGRLVDADRGRAPGAPQRPAWTPSSPLSLSFRCDGGVEWWQSAFPPRNGRPHFPPALAIPVRVAVPDFSPFPPSTGNSGPSGGPRFSRNSNRMRDWSAAHAPPHNHTRHPRRLPTVVENV